MLTFTERHFLDHCIHHTFYSYLKDNINQMLPYINYPKEDNLGLCQFDHKIPIDNIISDYIKQIPDTRNLQMIVLF